ncbi:hypothetical protein [uncultured Winogradskyella sp.]|uniref:hypothetical protein n=1 Tax=uncultured Winogradskyella sp. TaxID=395353 RepID=UPI0026162019|nr:hypothetical protein [uncultured Winogradskyella sp.]
MKKTKGSILYSAIGYLVKGLWKLFLLGLYGLSKLMEVIAGFLSKVLEKMLN